MSKATSLPHAVDLERLEHTDDPGVWKLRSHTVYERLDDRLCAILLFPIDWSRTATPSGNLCNILVRKMTCLGCINTSFNAFPGPYTMQDMLQVIPHITPLIDETNGL